MGNEAEHSVPLAPPRTPWFGRPMFSRMGPELPDTPIRGAGLARIRFLSRNAAVQGPWVTTRLEQNDASSCQQLPADGAGLAVQPDNLPRSDHFAPGVEAVGGHSQTRAAPPLTLMSVAMLLGRSAEASRSVQAGPEARFAEPARWRLNGVQPAFPTVAAPSRLWQASVLPSPRGKWRCPRWPFPPQEVLSSGRETSEIGEVSCPAHPAGRTSRRTARPSRQP